MKPLKAFKDSDSKILLHFMTQLDSQKRCRQIKQTIKEIGSFLKTFHFSSEQYEMLHIITKLVRCRLLSIQLYKLIEKL